MKTKTLCFIFLSQFCSCFFAACLGFAFFSFSDSSVKSVSKITSRLKTKLLFALLVFSCLSGLAQESDSLSRDEAIEMAARAVFDSKARPIRQKQKQFEDNTGIKVQFRVEDASLDKLGGLSEHLFKLFQNFTSLQNTNANTITGELSLLKNNQLSGLMSYRTRTTADLSACLFPEKETQSLDDRYSKWLSGNLSVSEENINEAPASVDEMFPAVMTDYEALRYKNKDCPGAFQQEVYDAYVVNTIKARSNSWSSDTKKFSNNLIINFQGLTELSSGNNNVGNPPPHYSNYRHFINLNQSVNQCTEGDLEASCKTLYQKTRIRLLFLTATVNYFIPRDSLQAFTAAAVESFSTNLNENLIIGLYLKMEDESTGVSCPILLVHQQNGEWLSKADIDFARYNTGGSYKAGTYYKFRNLIRNIPKPLIVCYQVAKINGLLSTVYIEKAQHVKGREQIYHHVFKCDKAFDEILAMKQEADAIRLNREHGRLDIYSQQRLDELKQQIRITRNKAMRHPEFGEPTVFKEAYVKDRALAEASALKYLKDKYGDLFANSRVDAVLDQIKPPTDIEVGTCITEETSDVIADVLSVSSLLLSPVGLDIIPDAISVLYFYATEQENEAALAIVSVAAPANVAFLRKAVGKLDDARRGIEAGEMLVNESNVLKLVSQNANEVMTAFKLDPALSGSGLIQKIEDLPVPTAELLTTDPNKAKTFLNVTEHLDEPKRREFVNKFLDDPDFRNTVIKNPDEVLRWGGEIVFNRSSFSHIEGFSEKIVPLLNEHNYTIEQFVSLQQKAFSELTLSEMSLMNKIRGMIENPDHSTILQKVVPKKDIEKYLSGQYVQVGGFLTTAKDAKHLKNYDDIYTGMRLDYSGSQFSLSDGSCGVIRYRSGAAPSFVTPKCIENGGVENSPMPFTGHGFTACNNGKLGVPEWKSGYITPDDGAELWEVFSDGTELIRARFSSKENRFISMK